MAFAQLIPFNRPLASVSVLHAPTRLSFTEEELAAKLAQARREAAEAARHEADQRLVEFRTEMQALSQGVLQQLAGCETALLAQLQAELPKLTIELSKRLLAGYEPSAETVAKVCRETLAQLLPERAGLELRLAPRDAELLAELQPDWLASYPTLKVTPDVQLAPGDCVVRSRFGVTDARSSTKLAALQQSLSVA